MFQIYVKVWQTKPPGRVNPYPFSSLIPMALQKYTAITKMCRAGQKRISRLGFMLY